MNPFETNVIVVGAGPAGLLLTELLRRAGIQVVIVERQADPTQVAQSVMVQPSVLGILQRLKVAIPVEASAGRIAGLDEYGPPGRLFTGRYDALADSPSTYGQLTTHGAVRRALLDRVGRFPGVTVLTSTRVTGISHDEVGDCRVEAQDDAGRMIAMTADWVVGADGRASVVREQARIGARISPFPHQMFLMPFATPSGCPPVLGVHRRPEGLAVTVPEALPGTSYVFTHLPAGDLDHAQLVAESVRIIGDNDPGIADALARTSRIERIMMFEPQTVCVDSWRAGGILLLGDSAHAMHSFGAQGLNISMQNAALYGDALIRYYRDGDLPAVDAVERGRRPFIESLHRAQHELGAQFWPANDAQGRSWYAGRFTEFALGQPEYRFAWQSVGADVQANSGG